MSQNRTLRNEQTWGRGRSEETLVLWRAWPAGGGFAQERSAREAKLPATQQAIAAARTTIAENRKKAAKLATPVTQEAMKQKRVFLDTIGFTTAKFLERQRTTRK